MTFPMHILFDLGNTLLYFDGTWRTVFEEAFQALQAAAGTLDLPFGSIELAERFRVRMETYYEQREVDLVEKTTLRVLETCFADLGRPNPDPLETNALLDAFYTATQAHWHPEDGLLAVLEKLRSSGCRLGILSNAAHDADVQTLVDGAGIRPFMDFVLTSAAIGVRKPHPETFLAALAAWETGPGQALMVGDTLEADIRGAHSVGMANAWIRRYARHRASGKFRPTYTIHSLAELPDLVNKLQKGD